jgi:DNA-binding response OmpR family regulator
MKPHIVIIEDDPAVLQLLEIILTKQGYRVTPLPALGTVEALIELKADCYIIDEQLPFVTGHIIAIILKSSEQTKNIPIILMSAYSELETFASLCKADAYLKKPFETNTLFKLLTSTLIKSRFSLN